MVVDVDVDVVGIAGGCAESVSKPGWAVGWVCGGGDLGGGSFGG